MLRLCIRVSCLDLYCFVVVVVESNINTCTLIDLGKQSNFPLQREITIILKQVIEYDLEIPQSHPADQSMELLGKVTENNSHKTPGRQKK